MRKQLLFTLFVLSLLIIAGCKDKEPKAAQVGFIGGTNGLVPTLNIVSTNLNEVFDNNAEPFQITVKLQNKGEYTVNQNEVLTTLSGIDLSAFQIQEANGVSTNLDVLEKARIEGGKLLPSSETVISYDANYKFDEPADKKQDMGVNVCYKYQTIASGNSCLRKDVTKPAADAKCKIDEDKTKSLGNSGAPVQLTLFTQKPADKNKLRFTVNIENKGKGEVYSPDFLSKGKCIDDQESKNKMRVKVAFPDSTPQVQCARLNNANEGIVTMIQNKATLTCTVDTSGLQDSTFSKSLITTVDYVYKDGVSGILTIRSTGA